MGCSIRKGVVTAATVVCVVMLLVLLSTPPAVEARVVGGRRAVLESSYFGSLLEILGSSDPSGCTKGSYSNGRPCP